MSFRGALPTGRARPFTAIQHSSGPKAFHIKQKCPVRPQAASTSGSGSDGFNKSAQNVGKEAGKKLREAYGVVEDNVKRTASQVNAKFDVTGKAQHAAEQVSEQAKAVDNRVGVKRRLRNVSDDFQRKLPIWRKKYAEFSRTSFGRATFLAGIFVLFYTGIIFKILNLLFILWWLAPFLFLLLNKIDPKAKERAAQKQAARREAQTRQQQYIRNMFFGSQQKPGQQQNQQRRNYGQQDSGPVIDVEYTSLDDN